jgi:hypothetical protein
MSVNQLKSTQLVKKFQNNTMSYTKLSMGSTPKSCPLLKPFKFIQRRLFPPPISAVTAKDVPQWRWSQHEFQTWLVEYMVKKGGADRGEAVEIALRYHDRDQGEMYYLSQIKWQEILGRDMGKLIYKGLQKVERRAGTTPMLIMDEEGDVKVY